MVFSNFGQAYEIYFSQNEVFFSPWLMAANGKAYNAIPDRRNTDSIALTTLLLKEKFMKK